MEYQKFSTKTLRETKIKVSLAVIILVVSALLLNFPWENSAATTCSTSPCNTTFQVNVQESLTVSITTPQNWASGDAGTFLRNKINLSVSTNSASGFTAYMHSKNTTNLTNAVSDSSYIQTLTGGTQKGSFSDNRWGYSLGTSSYNSTSYGETDAGIDSSTYYPMSTSNITILDNTAGSTRDIYFGAKANSSQDSGTYLGTVVFSVITSNDPSSDPANPTDDTPNDNSATHDNINDRTVYTTTGTTAGSSGNGYNGSATNTTTTQVSAGDVTSLYAPAQGEIRRTESNIIDGANTATGLAVAASTAAAGGMIFFILAKRREDDEEEEEELQ